MIFLLLNQSISTYFLSPPLIKMFVQTRTSDSFSLLMNKDHLKHRIRIKLNILPIYKKNVKIDRKQERAKVNSQFSLQTTKSKLNQTGQSRYLTQAKFMRSSQKLKVSRSQSSKNIYDTLSNISSMQEITTKNWCLYDSKSCEYYGFRSDYRRQIASLTKIMTVFISISFFQFFKISLKSKVKITKTAAEMIGTSANLKQDRWVSVQDLLYGTMLPSGNDAAYLLAEYIGYLTLENSKKGTKQNNKTNLNFQSLDLTKENTIGYVQEFVRMMNDKASQMNLINTRFSNPHGLQNALNLSSAKDIVKISLQASNNRLFSKIMNTHYHKYEIFLDDSFKIIETKRWWNTNKLLQNDWQGVKTGHTNSAGSCLSSLKEGIFITVLNCSNMDTRFSDTEEIFRWYLHLKDPSYKLTKIQTQIQSSNDKDRYSNVPTQASI